MYAKGPPHRSQGEESSYAADIFDNDRASGCHIGSERTQRKKLIEYWFHPCVPRSLGVGREMQQSVKDVNPIGSVWELLFPDEGQRIL